MKGSDIPKDVMSEITRYANDNWGDDSDMRKYFVDSESTAYIKLQNYDFGAAISVKKEIIDTVLQLNERWEDRLSVIDREIRAYQELQTMRLDGVPNERIQQMKEAAALDHPGAYADQRDYVVKHANDYLYVQNVRAKVGPSTPLLLKMERIIGNECYNGNIQNYGAGGVWEGEGRAFRYPVTFVRDGKDSKSPTVPSDIAPEVLMTGHYKFGANELCIFRALVKVIEMIEADYCVSLAGSVRR
jgi:hypothetical protein